MASNQICIALAILNQINFILLVQHYSKENINGILRKE